MRLKLVGEAIFQPGRIVGTVAGKSVVLGGRSALSAIAIAENISSGVDLGPVAHTSAGRGPVIELPMFDVRLALRLWR